MTQPPSTPPSARPSSWPDWPHPASEEQLAFDRDRLLRNRQRLIDVAQLSTEQVRRFDEISALLTDGIEKAFDSAIAPYATAGKAVPPEELRRYKVQAGAEIEKANAEVVALVPGGSGTLQAAQFILSSQIRLPVMQKVTYLAQVDSTLRRR